MPKLDPDKQRWFAVEVVKQLRARGFEGYWAGGCVRDQLLKRPAKDYDVATSARPDEIREVFGPRRTLAVGAAFGVISVLGPQGAGQIEVATFRQDLGYSDGRRPDEVRFTSPREDALRRDFTINGMFYDPLKDEVIDFVGGREDLQARVVRAIGEARERFGEDKLRMLRAVRFAATLDFSLEEQTRAAIAEMAPQIKAVSAERIAAEMRAMLTGQGRARACDLLRETGLLVQILPELSDCASQRNNVDCPRGDNAWTRRLQLLETLEQPTFPQALAVVLGWPQGADLAEPVAARWRLSNAEASRTAWLLRHGESLAEAARQPWSRLQPVLVHPGIRELLGLVETAARLAGSPSDDAAFCRQKLAQPRDQLDPPPLVDGEDLIQWKIPKGKIYSVLLKAARAAQLDGTICTPEDAKDFILTRWRESE